MRLYRKIIPKIAREIVRTLHSKAEVEVEDGRMDEAELDLAAVMVEYMNEEERIVAETKETMARRGFSQERFSQVKKSLAEARGFKLGDDGVEYVLDQMQEALFSSKNIAEVYADGMKITETRQQVSRPAVATQGPTMAFIKVLTPVPAASGTLEIRVGKATAVGGAATPLFKQTVSYNTNG